MLKEKLISLASNFPNHYKLQVYSGRGMFSKTCLGLVVSDLGEIFHLGSDVGVCAWDTNRICVDNMGMGYIVYFPEIELTNDDLMDFS